MPGYLESLMNPQTMGLLNLGAGLLAASGPSPFPVSTGAALGRGIQQGLQGLQNAQLLGMEKTKTDLLSQQLAHAKSQFEMQQAILRRLGMLPQSGAQTSIGVASAAPIAAPSSAPVSPVISNPSANQLAGAPISGGPAGAGSSAAPTTHDFPFSPLDMAGMKLAGLPDLSPFYNMSRPDAMTVDAGNEIRIVDKHDPSKIYQRITKGAAPGAVPFEASDINAGSYRDFLLNKARASASQVQNNVNAYTPASEAAQTQFMQSTRQNYEKLREAPVLINNLQQAKKIAESGNPFIGSLGDKKAAIAQFFNNNFGTNIAPDELADASALRTRLFERVKDQLKKMDATPSQMQQQKMEDAFGSLTTDPKALGKIIDVADEIVRGQVGIHNKEVEGAAKRGVKFPYDPIIKLPEATPQQQQFPVPSAAAINRLKMNPKERDLFETTFGPGSAAKVLGR